MPGAPSRTDLVAVATIGRVSTHGLQFDGAEKRALRRASSHPRIPVGCAAVTLRTRFTVFADRAAHSRPFVDTRPIIASTISEQADASVSVDGRVEARRCREDPKSRERGFRLRTKRRADLKGQPLPFL
jgi:hypothetical protein